MFAARAATCMHRKLNESETRRASRRARREADARLHFPSLAVSIDAVSTALDPPPQMKSGHIRRAILVYVEPLETSETKRSGAGVSQKAAAVAMVMSSVVFQLR